MDVHPTDPNTVMAAGYWYDTNHNYSPILMRTTNGGSNWNEITTVPYHTGCRYVYDVIYDPFNPEHILIATDDDVLHSTNGGSTWTQTTLNSSTEHLIADPSIPDTYFAGTSWNGVYCSTDGGDTWTTMNDGLLDDYINYLDIDPVNRYLYAATSKWGVARHALVPSSVEGDHDERPDRFVLYANYPNPFNATTQIEYETSRNGHVRLAVYDLRGRLVRILVDGYERSGLKRAIWNGRDMSGNGAASGVYLISLQTKHGSTTTKAVLQR